MQWTKIENGRRLRRSLNPNIKLFIESMGVGLGLYALLWLLAAI
ncbi:hypothetical protein [Mitsuokella sp. AF21-1AC]|nr:hypothetical protein [Mitsuokella sp. AF21-1AC]